MHIGNEVLQHRTRRGAQLARQAGLVLQRAGGQGVIADAEFFQQAGELGYLQFYTDRAGQGGFAGEDAGGRHGDHVAGRGGGAAHHGDHRLFRGHAGDGVVQRFAAGDGAAGAVDGHQQGTRGVVLGHRVDRLDEAAILGDGAGDGQAGDVLAAQHGVGVAAEGEQAGDHHRQDRHRPPQEKAALEAPPVQ